MITIKKREDAFHHWFGSDCKRNSKGNLTLSSHWHLIISITFVKVGTRLASQYVTFSSTSAIYKNRPLIERTKQRNSLRTVQQKYPPFWFKIYKIRCGLESFGPRGASPMAMLSSVFCCSADRRQWPFWASACGYNIRTWHASQWHHTSPPTLLRASLCASAKSISSERRRMYIIKGKTPRRERRETCEHFFSWLLEMRLSGFHCLSGALIQLHRSSVRWRDGNGFNSKTKSFS